MVWGADGDNCAGPVAHGHVTIEFDPWHIEGEYFVRERNLPRTTLFSPLGCPGDPPPSNITHVEAPGTTKPWLSGALWPELGTVGDC